MFRMNLKQLVHKNKRELFQSLELLQQGTGLSHQKITSDKLKKTRFKSSTCSQPDQIDNIPREESVSQEMVHIVYQLFVLMLVPPSKKFQSMES
jgi:hypothetical protein